MSQSKRDPLNQAALQNFLTNLGSYKNKIEEERRKHEEEIHEHEKKEEELFFELYGLDKTLNKCKLQTKRDKEIIKKNETEITDLKSLIKEQLEQNKKSKETIINAYEQKIRKLQESNETIRTQLKKTTKSMNQQINTLLAEYDTLQRNRDDLQLKSTDLSTKYKEISRQLKDAHNEITKLHEDIKTKKNVFRETKMGMEQDIQQQGSINDSLRDELRELRNKCNFEKSEHEEYEQQLIRAGKESIQKFAKIKKTLLTNIKLLLEEDKHKEEKIESLWREDQQKDAEIETLRQRLRQIEKAADLANSIKKESREYELAMKTSEQQEKERQVQSMRKRRKQLLLRQRKPTGTKSINVVNLKY